MSDAVNSFERGIRDADALLEMFDQAKGTPEAANAEVLKRAALVIAVAAWETYLKARIREEFANWLRAVDGSSVGKFIQRKLDEDLKRFFNPNSERTKRLFMDYFEVDVTKEWIWGNYDSAAATKALDNLIRKRGDAAHQANTSPHPSAVPHSVKREELEKGIRFLRGLVARMEKIKIAR
jgi:hypothetical protein